uniref:Putative secreted protein n=1 Tax=Ixodes ricinus TaxID=34613 RepID=A0A6B0UR12_IXORI
MSALLTGVVAAGPQPLAGGTAPAVVTQGGVAAVPGVAPMVDTEGSEVAVPLSQSPVGAVCWVSPPCGEQAWDSGSLMGRSSRMQDPSRLKEGSLPPSLRPMVEPRARHPTEIRKEKMRNPFVRSWWHRQS